MITRIQALNYRCLRYVDVALDRFHVLVGPNASGKSSLFDVVSFVGNFMARGLEHAVLERTYNFQDLVWGRPSDDLGFEIALEFRIPSELRRPSTDRDVFHTYRYELAIREVDREPRISSECGLLISGPVSRAGTSASVARPFPEEPKPPKTIMTPTDHPNCRTVLRLSPDGSARFHREILTGGFQAHATGPTFSTGLTYSALPFALAQDRNAFPVSACVENFLAHGVNKPMLEPIEMRLPRPVSMHDFPLPKSNMPLLIRKMRDNEQWVANVLAPWLRHVQTVLEELVDIEVVERLEDRTLYLKLKHRSGLEVPSWMASDGTLRFLKTLLFAYMADPSEIWLVEEPENCVHPLALDPIYQAFSTAFDSQVLISTHSTTFLSMSSPDEILCFAKTEDGATDIIRGDRHPLLVGQDHVADMDALFAKMVAG